MRSSLNLAAALITGSIVGIAGARAANVASAAAAPKAYIIAQIDVADPVAYRPYAEQAATIVASFGGHYLARGGATKSIEGEAPSNRVAVIEFPSMEALEKFEASPEYTAVKPIRQHASKSSRIFAVEGVAP